MTTTTDHDFEALKQIGDVSADGVIIYSFADDRVAYANEHAYQLVRLKADFTSKEIESLMRFVIPQDRDYLKNQYSNLTGRSMASEVEFQLLNEDGRRSFLCCNAFLLANRSAIVVFIKDISKPKQHENYLVQYGARKNTVLDTVAHHISGALNLMQHLTTEAKKYVDETSHKNLEVYLGLLGDNSTYCLEVIYELLKNEHAESPSIAVKNSRIDIVEKISFIYKELAQSYPDRRILFQTSLHSIYINTDEVKLLQVFNNLTSNAIKFSTDENEILIAISDTQHEVVISVKDDGIGIPDKLKPFIFHDQFGAGRRGLNGERSIGIGLSMCKNLVDLMNGRLWFNSEEGTGSTFYLALPK